MSGSSQSKVTLGLFGMARPYQEVVDAAKPQKEYAVTTDVVDKLIRRWIHRYQ